MEANTFDLIAPYAQSVGWVSPGRIEPTRQTTRCETQQLCDTLHVRPIAYCRIAYCRIAYCRIAYCRIAGCGIAGCWIADLALVPKLQLGNQR
jgi:hypothetical protein